MPLQSNIWNRASIWIVPAVIIVVVVVIVIRATSTTSPVAPSSAAPADQTAAAGSAASSAVAARTPQALVITGANLLRNPTFAQGSSGWITYHNATPMPVSFQPAKPSHATIRINGVATGVQEISQMITAPKGTSVVARGSVSISGAPLPAGASVIVMFVDSSGHSFTGARFGPENALGTTPFAFAFTPNGYAKQFVLAAIVGENTNQQTAISFSDLKVGVQGP